jgi:hypothetical protein
MIHLNNLELFTYNHIKVVVSYEYHIVIVHSINQHTPTFIIVNVIKHWREQV